MNKPKQESAVPLMIKSLKSTLYYSKECIAGRVIRRDKVLHLIQLKIRLGSKKIGKLVKEIEKIERNDPFE